MRHPVFLEVMVAQICNLVYRRFAICQPWTSPRRHRTARSVWSARSLLPLSSAIGFPSDLGHSTVLPHSRAAASCAHSKRFAPCRHAGRFSALAKSSRLQAISTDANRLQICARSVLVLLCSFFAFSSSGSQATEEQNLLAVLQSTASLGEKDAACARLKRIGTAKAVPALSNLLLDEQLSHSARYALESMPIPEAGRALLTALARTTGLTQVGIINSLGLRRERQAVPALAELLAAAERRDTNSEDSVPIAAAQALGQIATPKALAALQTALEKCPPATNYLTLRDALADGLLRCANHALLSGNKPQALSVFKHLYETETRGPLRLAAFRGMILSSGKQGLALMTSAILGESTPARNAALQLVRELPGHETTEALARLLPNASPVVKVA